MSKKVIPAFFAADENYIPYLTVSLLSVKQNASKENEYHIYILNIGIDEAHADEITAMREDWFRITFVNVQSAMEGFSKCISLRDYYTSTTYFRIFIADMFPQYDKALYLDSDTVVNADIAELYDYSVKGKMITGIPDGAVQSVPEMQEYVEKALGIKYTEYFNAGIIVMNLKIFRETNFYGQFAELIKKYKFKIAQDQDYLNVICKGKTNIISNEWNTMPGFTEDKGQTPKLVHYNLTAKPWHYEGLTFEKYFWYYAKQTKYYDFILNERANYSEEKKRRDSECEKNLIKMCIEEANSENNYYNLFGKKN